SSWAFNTKLTPDDSGTTCASGSRSSRCRSIRTRPLIEFGRFAADRRAQRGLGKPETFNFLGFTFICERNSRGQFLVKRITRRDRMRATLREIKEELRRRMHRPIPEQGAWIKQVVRGFFAYHAVPTNGAALRAFY